MATAKIGFVLISNSHSPLPSTRISVLNMFPYLRSANFEPHIVFEPEGFEATPDVTSLFPRLVSEGFHVVYFQRVHGTSVVELARQLSAAGVKTVFGVCDIINAEMAEVTDLTLVVTEYLKNLYPSNLQSKIHVVHDGIERPELFKTNRRMDRGSTLRPLRAVLVSSSHLGWLPIIGSPPSWLKVDIVGHYPQGLQRWREARWKLANMPSVDDRRNFIRFLLNPRINCHQWNADGVYDNLLRADIGIIPIDTLSGNDTCQNSPLWKRKSENRLTMKMSIGLPVVATPIPAYEAIIDTGKNGFLVNSPEQWCETLVALRDPELRLNVGRGARESVETRFSMQEQANRLTVLLNRVNIGPSKVE
jgi:glycosyltransferase involved in cell wall biosynthesis